MRAILRRLLHGDQGQDIAEYAMLVAFVGLVVLAAFLALQDAIHDGYTGWDTRDQQLGSCTPGPDGAGCS